jgi:hypothetical protein
MFNRQIAENHLVLLLKQYGINVIKWSTTSCGRSNWKEKTIKIPHPTNTDTFCVCMHEIKHIIDGDAGKRYEQEFYADMFAIEQAELLGFETTEYRKRMKRDILISVAMAHNRKFNIDNLNADVKAFLSGVDFELWAGHKVFVQGNYTSNRKEYEYEITYKLK